MKIHFAFALSALAVVSSFGCGRHVSGGTGGLGAGGGSMGDGAPGPISSASCESTVAEAGSPPAATAGVPLNHRASPCCSSQRAPGPETQPYGPGVAATGSDSVACSLDSQCLSGTNGRCFPFEGIVGPGGCSYDECSTDSDCPSGTPCICRTSPTDNSANVCAPRGNCTVDSDCGPDRYCSPSNDACYGSSQYFCHTALDTCSNDADCPSVDGGYPNFAACAYDQQARHWACIQLVCYLP
jgi:hypothetical protein